MSTFPATTNLSTENLNNSDDTPQSSRAVLKEMTDVINSIIDSYAQPNGICDLTANGNCRHY
jgi:hypothetical protein